MKGWFLRMKISHKVVGDSINIYVEGFVEFYLNQFYEEFSKLSHFLFKHNSYYELNTPLSRWMDYQRDLMVEGHRDEHPDFYTHWFDPKFGLHRRIGAGSNVPFQR